MKLARLSSSVMLSQASSDSQAGAGFLACWERSKTMPPLRKNCHSSLLIWEALWSIRTHIWSDSSSLCRSKRPLQRRFAVKHVCGQGGF